MFRFRIDLMESLRFFGYWIRVYHLPWYKQTEARRKPDVITQILVYVIYTNDYFG